MIKKIYSLGLILVLFSLFCELSNAEEHRVIIAGRQFSPKTISIKVGDSVKWIWRVNGHDVESGNNGIPNRFFDSGVAGIKGKSFRKVFSTSFINMHPTLNRKYHYYCSYHWRMGMQGVVIVKSPAS